MAHYALIDNANIVQKVIVGIDETKTDDLPEEFSSWEEFYANLTKFPKCKRTSYNTFANAHNTGGTPFRGNYAGIGYTYDDNDDVFYMPQPFNSWILNNDYVWEAPLSFPADANLDGDTTLPQKYYIWLDDLYMSDNTKGWVHTVTLNYNDETEEWE